MPYGVIFGMISLTVVVAGVGWTFVVGQEPSGTTAVLTVGSTRCNAVVTCPDDIISRVHDRCPDLATRAGRACSRDLRKHHPVLVPRGPSSGQCHLAFDAWFR